jgi:hypothetical protein
MRLEAVLEQHDAAADHRTTARRTLKLAVRSRSQAGGEHHVVVHNISRTGFLIEAPEGGLAVGDGLFLDVPEDGEVESKVVWESGRLFGCKFRSPVSQAAVSGALLQGDPITTAAVAAEPSGGPLRAAGVKLGPELNLSVALATSLLLWGAILAGGYLLLR